MCKVALFEKAKALITSSLSESDHKHFSNFINNIYFQSCVTLAQVVSSLIKKSHDQPSAHFTSAVLRSFMFWGVKVWLMFYF